MTNLDIMQIAKESGKKGAKLSNQVDYILSCAELEFIKKESNFEHIIQDILELFPEQNMREYMLTFMINYLCHDIDAWADAMKLLIRDRFKHISCVVEESQNQEAE